jgi:DNA helicase-2/ATP-dependent DNA helicase PcrA
LVALTPNPEQQAVIDAGDGVFAVYSGPGSGKSFCLIHRYARLVQSGVSPDDILCVTFTAASAKSMRDRANDLLPVQKMDRVSGWMTLHSLALKFVEQERANFPMELAEFPLCLEPQSNRLAWEAGKRYEVDPRRLKNFIGLQKRQSIRPIQAIRAAEKEHKDEKLALAYKYYETKMREAKVLDFDSLLMEMRQVLEANAEVRERWSYKYVQLDEAQDTDEQQFAILELLTRKHGNLLAVGDTQQGLYGFRGARGDLFLNMSLIFTGALVLYLAKNHRSTQEIVGFLKEIGPDKDLAARFHTDNSTGTRPIINHYAGPAEEARAVVAKIQEMSK